MIKKSNKVVLLLSGGLDSAVVLSICKKLGHEVDAITFDYNQRHKVELNCAKWQAANFKCVSHKIFKLDFFGGSSLTDNIDVPKNENIKKHCRKWRARYWSYNEREEEIIEIEDPEDPKNPQSSGAPASGIPG